MNSLANGLGSKSATTSDITDKVAKPCACGPACKCGSICKCQPGATCTPACKCVA
jgi:hypothetical protein